MLDNVYLVFSRVLCILLVILSIAACFLSLGNRSVLLSMTIMREQVSWPIKRHSAVCVCIPFTTSTTNIIRSMIWAPECKHTDERHISSTMTNKRVKSSLQNRKKSKNKRSRRPGYCLSFPSFSLPLSGTHSFLRDPLWGREEVKLEPRTAPFRLNQPHVP